MILINKYISLLCISLMLGTFTQAQEVFTLADAIRIALDNNSQIEISRFDTQISDLQVDPALVGRTPQFNLIGSYAFGWSDASIETLPLGPGGGGENSSINLDGISHTVVLGPEITLLLFDGKASKYRLNQLGKQRDIAKLQLRQTIESTVSSVSQAFINISRQQSLMDITRQNIALTQERLDRAVQNAAYGTSSSLEQLQIEVDLKTDSVTLRNQMLEFDNAIRSLEYLMGEELPDNIRINAQLDVDTQLELETLRQSLIQENTLLQLLEQNGALAELDVELAKAAYRPSLQGFANINYTYIENEANFLQSNRTIGPNAGVRLNVPILDGGARNIRKQTAELNQQKIRVQQADTQQELLKELNNAYATYQNSLEQLRIERSNLVAFERNLENMQNEFTLGQVTNTDVRQAQLNLNAARNRINNYQYTLKQVEIVLRLLAGQLVNE